MSLDLGEFYDMGSSHPPDWGQKHTTIIVHSPIRKLETHFHSASHKMIPGPLLTDNLSVTGTLLFFSASSSLSLSLSLLALLPSFRSHFAKKQASSIPVINCLRERLRWDGVRVGLSRGHGGRVHHGKSETSSSLSLSLSLSFPCRSILSLPCCISDGRS